MQHNSHKVSTSPIYKEQQNRLPYDSVGIKYVNVISSIYVVLTLSNTRWQVHGTSLWWLVRKIRKWSSLSAWSWTLFLYFSIVDVIYLFLYTLSWAKRFHVLSHFLSSSSVAVLTPLLFIFWGTCIPCKFKACIGMILVVEMIDG